MPKHCLPYWLVVVAVLPAAALHAQHSTGLVFAEQDRYLSIPLASTPVMGVLPQIVDLSTNFPAVGDQGTQGSCVAWALAYDIKSYQELIDNHWSANVPEHVFSPAFVYNQLKASPDCRGGITVIDALDFVQDSGVETLASFPYDPSQCSRMPTVDQSQNARQHRIGHWLRVNIQSPRDVKASLASGFPVLIAMDVDSQFEALRAGQIYRQYSGASRGGHAVVVVGYDDMTQTFKIINSWGRSWADSGFARLSYGAFRQVVREGYVAQSMTAVSPPSPSDSEPTPSPIQRPVVTIDSASVFQSAAQLPGATRYDLVWPAIGAKVSGSVSHARGQVLRFVTRYSMPAGQSLTAKAGYSAYADVDGLLATQSPTFSISSDDQTFTNVGMSLPWPMLNVPEGPMPGAITVTVYAYLNNFLVAQSQPMSYTIRR